MPGRRFDDRAPAVLVAAVVRAVSAGADSLALIPASEISDSVASGAIDRLASGDQPPLFLVELGGELCCLAGAELRRLPREPGVDIASVVASFADSMREHHAAMQRKQQFCEGFPVWVEHTNRAASARDVYEALLDDVPRLMDVHAVVIFVRVAGGGQELRPLTDSRITNQLGSLSEAAVFPHPVPAPITVADTAPGEPFAALAPLFHEGAARYLACVAMGERALLILVERRASREFTGEDWFRVQIIARHADRALERIQLCTPRADRWAGGSR